MEKKQIKLSDVIVPKYQKNFNKNISHQINKGGRGRGATSTKSARIAFKAIEKEGVLEKTHENVFIVRIKDHNQIRRLSYTYSDLLTDNVIIKSKDDESKIGV